MTKREGTDIGNRLSDMAFDEVSLVSRGANQDAKVVLFKADVDEDSTIHNETDSGDTLDRSNQTKENKTVAKRDDQTKAPDLSGLPEEVAKSVQEYIDDVTAENNELRKDNEDLAEAIAADLDEEVDEIEEDDEYEDEDGDEEDEDGVVKNLTKLDPEEIAKLDPMTQALVKSAQRSEKRAKEAEAIAKAERDSRELGESVEVAKGITDAISADPKLLGAALMDIAKNCADATHAVIVEAITSANEIAKTGGGVTKEYGTDRGREITKADVTAFEEKAEAIVKADPTMTKEQALVKAAQDDPDAYAEYVQKKYRS